MDYRRLFLELLVLLLPSKKKISSQDVCSWFGLSLKPANPVLALIFRSMSFRLIVSPKVSEGIVLESLREILLNPKDYIEILLRIELDIIGLSIMPSYDLLNLLNLRNPFSGSFLLPSAWTLEGLRQIFWLLFPKKWKVKGPASFQWNNKKGMSRNHTEGIITH
jgi:hypothetical protein